MWVSLYGARCFRLDARKVNHSRDALYGIVSIGAISESGQIASVLQLEVFCLFGCFRTGIGMRLHCQFRENRLSRRNLVFDSPGQPPASLIRTSCDSASIGVHDPEDIHRLSIAGLSQAVETGRSFLVPTD